MEAPEVQKSWRLLIDPPYEGPQNMAIDEALLDHCASEENAECVPTLRLYQWSRPTLSIGYNQNIQESIHVDFCEERDIPVVRRPTGGKAVLHDKELTYSVTACFSMEPFQTSVFANYRMLSEAITGGLRLLGIDAVIADGDAPSYSRCGPEACFARLSRYEISCKRLKLVGSAQRRKRKAFIQHGSVLMEADRGLIKKIITSERSQQEMDFITVKEVLGRAVTFEELAKSIVEGFEQRFQIRLQKATLTNEEKELARLFAKQRSF